MLIRLYGIELLASPSNSRAAPSDEFINDLAKLSKLVDRAEEILIFESPDAASEAAAWLDRHEAVYEELELVKLSSTASVRFEPGALYEDYAIIARSGNVIFDLKLVAAFRLTATKPDAEPAPALLQLEEHLIGSLSSAEGSLHVIDRQLTPLADRIARAYGCASAWEC